MKFILIFAKKISLRVNALFIVGPKMLCCQNCGYVFKDLFIILYNERDEEAHEN